MSDRSPPVISVSALRWEIGGRTILDGIDLELFPGETLGVVGPNGSGKSSLLRCVFGEQQPTDGHIYVNGRPLVELSRRELARTMAVLFQHQSVDAGVTVAQVIEIGRLPHRRLLEQATAEESTFLLDCARRTGVIEFLDAPFARLSGGEQQRVVLARALAQEPSILLLDEPTNHLDLRYQVELTSLLAELGLPTIVVVHDLTLAARICDRLVVLDAGRVHADGPPDDVLERSTLARVWNVDADVLHDSGGNAVVVATDLAGERFRSP